MKAPVVLLSIPQLRRRDVTPGALASLERLAAIGGLADLDPIVPAVAATAFATLVSGVGPYRHGIVGNRYYDRQAGAIVEPPLPDSANTAPKCWERIKDDRPDATTMLWFGPNTAGASVDYAAGLDGAKHLHVEPPDLAEALQRRLGPFPRPDPADGEVPAFEATAWLLASAAFTIADRLPDLAIVRVPYLGQVARRDGPDGRRAARAILALDRLLAPFFKALPEGTRLIAATESVSTPVSAPVHPNAALGQLGLLARDRSPTGEVRVDRAGSAAFVVSDHQIGHVYLNDLEAAPRVASAFSGRHGDGIAAVLSGPDRARLGLDHPRSGDMILVARPDRWFEDDCQPPIPSKSRRLPRGSHGAPPPDSSYGGVVVCNAPGILPEEGSIGLLDLEAIYLERLP